MAPEDDSSTLGVLPAPSGLPDFRGSEGRLRQPLLDRGRPGSARLHHGRFPPLYQLVRSACAPALRRLFGLDVSGLEGLPDKGPFILAANHHNYLDGIVLGVAVPRPISFLVMPRVFHASPLHPAFHRGLGSIPVNLERPDPGAIKSALRVLGAGGVIGIFPEGPFSREGRLMPGQAGVAMIALRSGVPVVPAAVTGTYEALSGRRFYMPRLTRLAVRFGEPLRFSGPSRGRPGHPRGRHADREDITRRIMSHIAALLDAARPASARRGEADAS
jgi:1-acyl-sn-glycerol-3-phosphate acyltransferase